MEVAPLRLNVISSLVVNSSGSAHKSNQWVHFVSRDFLKQKQNSEQTYIILVYTLQSEIIIEIPQNNY